VNEVEGVKSERQEANESMSCEQDQKSIRLSKSRGRWSGFGKRMGRGGEAIDYIGLDRVWTIRSYNNQHRHEQGAHNKRVAVTSGRWTGLASGDGTQGRERSSGLLSTWCRAQGRINLLQVEVSARFLLGSGRARKGRERGKRRHRRLVAPPAEVGRFVGQEP